MSHGCVHSYETYCKEEMNSVILELQDWPGRNKTVVEIPVSKEIGYGD